jgi:hypothetical protein
MTLGLFLPILVIKLFFASSYNAVIMYYYSSSLAIVKLC